MFAGALLLLAGGSAPPQSAVTLPVNTFEPMLDDHVVAQMSGVSRRLVAPQMHESNPRVFQSLPWEARYANYISPVYDPVAELHKGIYLSTYSGSGIPAGPYPAAGEYQTSYMESADLIDWNKPLIGDAYGPWPATNIIIPSTHGWGVMYDPNDAQYPFKGVGGDYIGKSPDGFNWTRWQVPGLGANDTGSAVIKWKGKYRLYVRTQGVRPDTGGVLRRVAYMEADSFDGPWPDKVPLPSLDTITEGSPDVQPYAFVPFAVSDDLLVGWRRTIHLDPGSNQQGYTVADFFVSRDGTNWTKLGRWLSNDPGTWYSGMVLPPQSVYERDGKLIWFFSGSQDRHDDTPQVYRMGLATLPAGRFAALEGAGFIKTRPLEIGGDHLVLNADGDVRVSVLDAGGAPVPGFDDGVLSRLDKTHSLVTWTGGSLADAKTEAAGDIVLRFDIEPADTLYGFMGWDGVGSV